MKKICLTAVYFGSWPKWFPAFLASCAANQNIDWLIISDCSCDGLKFTNIHFLPMTMEDFNARASDVLGISVKKNPYSQVDLQPTYGQILQDFFRGYDFWGHVDIDVVWGNIRKFVTDEKLDSCDILSGRENAFAGHFTLYRNEPDINMFYRHHRNWQGILGDEAHHNFDEREMGILLKYRLPRELKGKIRLCWPNPPVLDWWELARRRNGWEWREGQLFDGTGKEHMYIHFMTWKPRMRHIDFKASEQPRRFRITHRGIWSQPMSTRDELCLLFPFRFLAESWSRYALWYWFDRSKWLRLFRTRQLARDGRARA